MSEDENEKSEEQPPESQGLMTEEERDAFNKANYAGRGPTILGHYQRPRDKE